MTDRPSPTNRPTQIGASNLEPNREVTLTITLPEGWLCSSLAWPAVHSARRQGRRRGMSTFPYNWRNVQAQKTVPSVSVSNVEKKVHNESIHNYMRTRDPVRDGPGRQAFITYTHLSSGLSGTLPLVSQAKFDLRISEG